jgi:phenylacetate-coenzyme A ligase PaaK-like adenylate-forming protein
MLNNHDIIKDLLVDPFSLNAELKRNLFIKILKDLTEYHVNKSSAYSSILNNLNKTDNIDSIESVPYLPVRLFKFIDLISISPDQIFKTLTSSGTSGQNLSKIYLDRYTADLQSKVLRSILGNFIGNSRRPMIIVDVEDLLKNRCNFSARAAGVVGFSIFGKSHFYCLDSNFKIKIDELQEFCNNYRDTGIFLFGFTSIIWKFFNNQLKQMNLSLDIGHKSILLHGGGWKKLTQESVSNEEFKHQLSINSGINRIHNYYGMVEQTGSIFIECEFGYMHASNFSDILIRDTKNYNPLPYNKPGLIQLLSLLPHSYPGHSILSEDIGICYGEDNCKCGRNGKYFHVMGRLESSEPRGCSDTRQVP